MGDMLTLSIFDLELFAIGLGGKDLNVRTDRSVVVAFSILNLPPTLDRPDAELPVFQPIGRLGCPMDFSSSIGVLLPMALCGRSVL